MERPLDFNELTLNEAWSELTHFINIIVYAYLTLQIFRCLYHVQYKELVYRLAKKAPMVSKQIDSEFEKIQEGFRHDLNPAKAMDPISELPEEGYGRGKLLEIVTKQHVRDTKNWAEKHVSGCVYIYDEELYEVTNQVCSLYNYTNPLHFDVFPSLAKFESEIISMVGNLFHTTTGCVTSGGTDSILLSAKAHRQWAEKEKGITKPEMILCTSSHAAWLKACDILKIKPVVLDIDKSFRMRPKDVKKAITKNTIMIIASAPNYPYGTFDPLEEISEIAAARGVGYHIDACLGGFVLPFAKRLGYDIPTFDFTLPGVTSISVDTHKYGFSCKGSSVLLYRSEDIRKHQYFHYPNWSGGLYTTGTFAGSRNGGTIAGTWSTLVMIGQNGYLSMTDELMKTSNYLKEEIAQIEELRLMGDPLITVIAFASDTLNIYQVYDKLNEKGWQLAALQKPPAIHITVTKVHVGLEQKLIADLKEVVAELKRGGIPANEFKAAPMYGTLAMLPSSPICDALEIFNNVVLEGYPAQAKKA